MADVLETMLHAVLEALDRGDRKRKGSARLRPIWHCDGLMTNDLF